MAISTDNFAIDGTAVLVVDQSPSGLKVHLHNVSQGTPIFIGKDSTVTSVTGFQIDAKDKVEFVLHAGEQLWAICANSSNAVLSVMRQTQYG